MRVHSFLIAAFAFLTACILSAAQASPITYTLTGTMTGFLGGATLTNSAFSLTLWGDTVSQRPIDVDVSAVPAVKQTLDIAGFGAIPLSAHLFAGLLSSTDLFLFTNADQTQGIAFSAPQLLGYDGTSAMGPTPATFFGLSILAVPHSGLVITNASDLMFEVSPTAGTVPEPLTLSLFGAGLAGAAAVRRRRA